jgi:hypothetical protein
MSSESVSPPVVSTAVAPPWPRWFLLVALLLGEVLLLTLRFDTASLYGRSEWWAELLGESQLLPRLFIVVAAATLLLGGASFWDNLSCLPVPPQLKPIERFWRLLRRRSTHNRLFDSLAELKASMRNSLRFFQTVRSRVQQLIDGRPQKAR